MTVRSASYSAQEGPEKVLFLRDRPRAPCECQGHLGPYLKEKRKRGLLDWCWNPLFGARPFFVSQILRRPTPGAWLSASSVRPPPSSDVRDVAVRLVREASPVVRGPGQFIPRRPRSGAMPPPSSDVRGRSSENETLRLGTFELLPPPPHQSAYIA